MPTRPLRILRQVVLWYDCAPDPALVLRSLAGGLLISLLIMRGSGELARGLKQPHDFAFLASGCIMLAGALWQARSIWTKWKTSHSPTFEYPWVMVLLCFPGDFVHQMHDTPVTEWTVYQWESVSLGTLIVTAFVVLNWLRPHRAANSDFVPETMPFDREDKL